MEKTFLPGDVRQRLTDLMKDQKVTQTELARKIGCGDSVLSRFISGQTDKLSNENIIRIARVFNVSTDFLLGITNVPDRKNYAIDELGLSAEAARNLFTEKVNTAVLNRLLESPRFAELTYTLEQYFNDTIAAGFAAQNQMYATQRIDPENGKIQIRRKNCKGHQPPADISLSGRPCYHRKSVYAGGQRNKKRNRP